MKQILTPYIKKLFLLFFFVLIFLAGFFARNLFTLKNAPTNTISNSKPQNILLPQAKDGNYKIVKVIDGDTVVLETGEKLRYLGINAPELNKPLGLSAQKFNQELVGGKTVRLEFDRDKLDKYGRLLAYVWLDNMLVNERMVEEGYARVYLIEHTAKLKYLERLQKAEQLAKNAKRGVWFETNY
ncbi:MAG: thermonuclease family protein [Patescibacteria group bacterium]|nr:thermonuclease family protein [Patescibacteria group bacterium]